MSEFLTFKIEDIDRFTEKVNNNFNLELSPKDVALLMFTWDERIFDRVNEAVIKTNSEYIVYGYKEIGEYSRKIYPDVIDYALDCGPSVSRVGSI